MGQADRRGSREERIEQAKIRQQEEAQKLAQAPAYGTIPKSREEFFKIQARMEQLFANLTTPLEVNAQVSQFAQILSDKAPIFLDCRPEPWSRQSCCDGNTTKFMEDHGGRMVCGYRIWYNEPLYIEGERHAVWTDGKEVRDVSFADTGETKILFVPDDHGFDDAPAKVRFAFDESDKNIFSQLDAMERINPMTRLSPKEAWDTMLTYEQWLAGKRMPNQFLAAK